MPYPPADRLLTISFERLPEEHVDAMIGVGRRLMADKRAASPWVGFGMAIGLGVLISISMELHRRLILPYLFGITETAPLGTAILQFLPLLLIAVGIYYYLYRRTVRSQRTALVSHLAPGLVIDIEIFKTGVAASTGAFAMEVDWTFISDVYVENNRVEIQCESLSLYIPERAFAKRTDFAEAFKLIRSTWREATKRDRDSKMVAAGLD